MTLARKKYILKTQHDDPVWLIAEPHVLAQYDLPQGKYRTHLVFRSLRTVSYNPISWRLVVKTQKKIWYIDLTSFKTATAITKSGDARRRNVYSDLRESAPFSKNVIVFRGKRQPEHSKTNYWWRETGQTPDEERKRQRGLSKERRGAGRWVDGKRIERCSRKDADGKGQYKQHQMGKAGRCGWIEMGWRGEWWTRKREGM